MKKKTTSQVINEFKTVHGNRYDYSRVCYDGATSKVCIICTEHGEFWQTPSSHLCGSGCPKCGNKAIILKQTSNTNEFKDKAKKKHGDTYIYDESIYQGSCVPLCIICPTHGKFWQTPHAHLTGRGCKECGREKNINSKLSNLSEFLKKAKKVHGEKYIYNKTGYNGAFVKICITCP